MDDNEYRIVDEEYTIVDDDYFDRPRSVPRVYTVLIKKSISDTERYKELLKNYEKRRR